MCFYLVKETTMHMSVRYKGVTAGRSSITLQNYQVMKPGLKFRFRQMEKET